MTKLANEHSAAGRAVVESPIRKSLIRIKKSGVRNKTYLWWWSPDDFRLDIFPGTLPITSSF